MSRIYFYMEEKGRVQSIYEKKKAKEKAAVNKANAHGDHKKVSGFSEKRTSSRNVGWFGELPKVLIWSATLLVPIFFIILPGFPISISKSFLLSTLVLLAAILWIAACFWKGRVVFTKSVIWLALALFLLSAFLSSFDFTAPLFSLFGVDIALDTFSAVLAFVLLAFLSSHVFRSRKNIKFFYLTFFLVYGLVFLFQISRVIFGEGFLSLGYFTGAYQSLVGSWFDLSFFLGFSAVLSLSAYLFLWRERQLRWLSIAVFGSALVFLSVFSNGVVYLLLTAVSLVLLGILSARGEVRKVVSQMKSNREYDSTHEGERESRRAKSVLFLKSARIILPLLLFVFSLSFLFFGGAITQKTASWSTVGSTVEIQPSWEATWKIYRDTTSEGWQSLLLGSGAQSFEKQWTKYRPESVNETPWWNINFSLGAGYFPTFAVTFGVFGVIVIFILAAAIFYEGWKGVTSIRLGESRTKADFFILITVALLYLFGALFLYTPGVVIIAFAFIFLGMFVGFLGEEGVLNFSINATRRRKTFFSLAGGVLFILFIVSSFALFFEAEKFYAAALSRKSIIMFSEGGNLEEAKAKMIRAAELHPRDLYYRNLAEIGVEEMRSMERQSQNSGGQGVNTEKLQRVFQETRKNAQKADELDPDNYQNTLFLGNLYRFFVSLDIEGAYPQAKKFYQETRELAPRLPSVDLNLAQLEFLQGNTDAALSALDQALQKKPDYVEASLLDAQIHLSEDRVSEANKTLTDAAQHIGNNAEQWYKTGVLFYQAEAYENAARSLLNALTLIPSYADAKYYLGLSYQELGNTEQAISLFEDIQDSNPGNAEVEKILRELRSGGY